MKSHRIPGCLFAYIAMSLAGCSTFTGASPAIDNFGPKAPREDGTASDKDKIYTLFQAAYSASSGAPTDGTKAMDMAKAAIPLVTQNCDNYFLSNGRQETYLLFGKDILTFGSSLGTAVLAASRASSRDVTAAAIAVTTVTGAADIYRKQLTYGADFTTSAKTMVDKNIQTFSDAVTAKKSSDYFFELAVQDIRDLQTLCVPSVIIADMSAAIASKQFTAISVTQPATTLPGGNANGGAQAPPPAKPSADDQAKAASGKESLLALQQKGLLANQDALIEHLGKLAAGQGAVAPPPQQPIPQTPSTTPVPANARLRLVP